MRGQFFHIPETQPGFLKNAVTLKLLMVGPYENFCRDLKRTEH